MQGLANINADQAARANKRTLAQSDQLLFRYNDTSSFSIRPTRRTGFDRYSRDEAHI